MLVEDGEKKVLCCSDNTKLPTPSLLTLTNVIATGVSCQENL